MAEEKIFTQEKKELLKSKSAFTLSNNPSSDGFSAEQIKRRLYEPILNLFDLIQRYEISNDTQRINLQQQIDDIVNGLTTVGVAKDVIDRSITSNKISKFSIKEEHLNQELLNKFNDVISYYSIFGTSLSDGLSGLITTWQDINNDRNKKIIIIQYRHDNNKHNFYPIDFQNGIDVYQHIGRDGYKYLMEIDSTGAWTIKREKTAEEYTDDLIEKVNEQLNGLALEYNHSNGVLNFVGKDENGNKVIKSSIDLPIEKIITNIIYNEDEGKIIFEFENYDPISVPIGQIIELENYYTKSQTEEYVDEKIGNIDEVLDEINGDGVVEEVEDNSVTTNKIANGAVTEEKLSDELKEKINSSVSEKVLKNLDYVINELDKYWHKENHAVPNYSNWNYAKYDIEDYEKVYVTGYGSTDTWHYGVTFVDSQDKTILQYTGVDDGKTEQAFTDLELNVPSGAKYVCINYKDGYDFGCKVLTEKVITKNDFDSLLKNESSTNPLDVIVSGGGLTNIFPKIACIGDSLTKGGMEWNEGSTGVVDYTPYSYPIQLKRMLGNEVYNLGLSGACASSSAKDGAGWNELATSNNWFSNEYKSQCYIIALGTNDIAFAGSFIGNTTTDIDISNYSNNANNSVGGYAKIIQRIKELEPRAKIFCVTIPNTRNTDTTRSEANTKIKDIANIFGCYVIDLETYGVQKNEVESWKAKYYNLGHLNCMGYRKLSEMIASYIDWIINNNPNEFYDTPAIGTDYR